MQHLSRATQWVFTLNAVGDADLPAKPQMTEDISFMCFQLERSATGRLHYQGLLRLKAKKSMLQVKKILKCVDIHLEVVKDWKSALKYVQKMESRVSPPETYGEDAGQGRRSDMRISAEEVRDGRSLYDIGMERPHVLAQYGRGLEFLKEKLVHSRKRPELQVYCLYGATGIGKSWTVDALTDGDLYRVYDTKAPWFDGYNQQKNVVFEDYGCGMMNIHLLKQVLDIYAIRVSVKGGSVAWNPINIFLTTNVVMGDWYPKASTHDMDALCRRIQWFDWNNPAERTRFTLQWKTRIASSAGAPAAHLPESPAREELEGPGAAAAAAGAARPGDDERAAEPAEREPAAQSAAEAAASAVRTARAMAQQAEEEAMEAAEVATPAAHQDPSLEQEEEDDDQELCQGWDPTVLDDEGEFL